LLLWAPVAAYMAIIFALSSGPSLPLPRLTTDKMAHAGVYGGLAILLVRAFAAGWPRRITARAALLAAAVTIAYGISDEWHQLFVPGRTADRADVLADAIGALVGTGVCWAWGTIRLRPDV
jgi:VanZ family protein